jgi:hypothetical protein
METDNVLVCLEADTPIIAKNKLKPLKKRVEAMYDISGSVDIHAFTLEICKEHQRAIARTSKPATARRVKG